MYIYVYIHKYMYVCIHIVGEGAPARDSTRARESGKDCMTVKKKECAGDSLREIQ